MIFKAIDTILLIARLIIKPAAKQTIKLTALKQKQGQLANSTNKRAKKNWAVFNFYYIFGLFLRCG